MSKPKLVRITTVPLSLDKLLEGQLAFMSSYFDITAISSDLTELKRIAKSSYFDITAISSDLTELKRIAKREGVDFFEIPMSRKITPIADIRAIWKLYRYLRLERPDIVHSHTPKAGLVGMIAARLANVPIRIHTVAGLPLMEARGFKKILLKLVEKITYQNAQHVWPNSFHMKDYIIENNFTGPEKVQVIGNGSSNGINLDYFNIESQNDSLLESIKTELGITKDDFTFIFVGRVVKDKGVSELVSAFQRLTNSYSNIHLVLVGEFETDLDPLPAVTLNGINSNPRIHKIGFKQDVRPYFSIADVLVFPSYREGFPNVVLQSLAMDCPAIVSNINGCNEIIQNGINGWIVEPKDEESLYLNMKTVLSDREGLSKVKQNTRTTVLKYKRENIWELLLLQYKTLLNGNS